ncbi:WD repeat-containing protein 97-like isoform X3 [Mytilus edulis]|uniref:WD repeat-containing protein 97-like isoform X3 n=1 Tax=Mytilus edulis TaxID=6550 RepID=UPI0039EED2AD
MTSSLTRFINNFSEEVESEGNLSKNILLLRERARTEEKQKAVNYWKLLRNTIRKATQAAVESDIKQVNISHGMHHHRKINHQTKLKCVIFIKERKEYLTTDGKVVEMFLEDGRRKPEKSMFAPEEPMDNIMYCRETKQFVGWKKGEDELFLMNDEFEIISQARVPSKIDLATYNNSTGEIMTFSPGFCVSWAFRYGARHLIPRKMTKTRFKEDKETRKYIPFKHMILEETASRAQKCYVSYVNSVVIFNVFEGKEVDHRLHLHEREISALTYFNPLKYLITAAIDGSIKVWDSKEWFLQMVFVGHTQSVTSLAVYPEGPAIMSSSKDKTVRVWNLDSCDEMDRAKVDETPEGMATELNYDKFLTWSGTHVDMWKIQHLFNIHTAIGQRVVGIKHTSHPFHPVRSVIVSHDCSIRIVSPPTGDVITTLLLDSKVGVVDAAYSIEYDDLFVVTNNGDIIKSKTDTNPCRIINTWKCQNPKEACNYLLVYEYVPDFDTDVWAAFKRGLATKSIKKDASDDEDEEEEEEKEKKKSKKSHNKTLLLGGRKDGSICVFDWITGKVTFKVDAHGSKGVLSMIANSKQDLVISAGMDNFIKVWRLYPFAEEALAPLMEPLFCAQTPIHMTMLKTNLCVALQQQTTATYCIVIYNLKDRTHQQGKADLKATAEVINNRFDHSPDEDHNDSITGLTSCPRLKLYASGGMDGTIRIWNDENQLIRLLKLKTMPYSLGFCSEKGDLLVGIGNHLYLIPHQHYLPKGYRLKMVSMKFAQPKKEQPLPFDALKLKTLSKRDFTRIKKSHSSFKYDHFEDKLTPEEEEEVTREKKIKQAAFAVLSKRDSELQKIREGEFAAKKPKLMTQEEQDRAFKNYMKMFYDKPRLTIPPDDPFPSDTASDYLRRGEIDEAALQIKDEPWKPEREPSGFFPPLSRSSTFRKSQGTPPEPLQAAYESATSSAAKSGLVPNSVLTKILWPPPPPPPPKDTWKLPTFEDGKMVVPEPEEEEVEEPPAEEEETEDQHLEFVIDDWGEKESIKSESSVTSPKSPNKREVTFSKKDTVHEFDKDKELATPTTGSRQSSGLMSKFKDIMAKPPSQQDDDDASTITLTPRSPTEMAEAIRSKESSFNKPPSPPKDPKPVVKPPSRREVKPLKPLTLPPPQPKVERAKSPAPLVKPSAPRQRTPTPPRPETPLPNYVTQFQGADWFDKYFPNCNENTFPKPWNADTFMTMLSRLLRVAEYVFKTKITDSLSMLYTQENISDPTAHSVSKTLISVLNSPKDPPTCLVEDQKSFIVAALQALSKLGIRDMDFITEMMVQFLDGDKEVRATTMDMLNSCGLQDQQKYFIKELDSWDIWNVEEADRKADLRKMVHSWLDRWMTSYKLHLEDTIERMKKGQNIHGKLNRGSKGILRKGSTDTVTTIPDRASITVTFDQPPDQSIVDSATYIDCINYFVEMMMDKALDGVRKGGKRPPGAQENVVQAKNTVLVLPKLPHKPALVRLGETHTSQCRPHRETNLHIDYRYPSTTNRGYQPPPGSLSGFAPSINLPMKPVYINPFPCEVDMYDTRFQEPILITLKSAQKYFVPAQSIVADMFETAIPPAR